MGKAPVPKPQTAPSKPKSAPSRPPQRTPPPRSVPAPGRALAPRTPSLNLWGISRWAGVAGVVANVLRPSPTGYGEIESPGQLYGPKTWEAPKGLSAARQDMPKKRGEVIFRPARETFYPVPVSRPTPDSPWSPVEGPAPRPGRVFEPVPRRPSNPWDDESDPFYDPDPYFTNSRRLPAPGYSPGYDRSRPDPTRRTIWDPRVATPPRRQGQEKDPGEGLPGRSGRNSGSPQEETAIVVEESGGETRVRIATRPRRVEPRRRFRDDKYGVREVAIINRVLDVTIGPISEMIDAAESLAWNVYGLDSRGRVVHAMDMEDRSIMSTLAGFARGEYRVDAVGFTVDYSVAQLSDLAIGKVSQATDDLGRGLGMRTPFGQESLNRLHSQQMEGTGNVQSDGIQAASAYLRSFDAQRAQRVRGLFP